MSNEYVENGTRIHNENRVWIIFHGRKHLVVNSNVYDSLFNDTSNLINFDFPQKIVSGPDLLDGTCLVQSLETKQIFFVVASREPTRYLIPSWDCFVKFGFSLEKTFKIPHCIVEYLRPGGQLEND